MTSRSDPNVLIEETPPGTVAPLRSPIYKNMHLTIDEILGIIATSPEAGARGTLMAWKMFKQMPGQVGGLDGSVLADEQQFVRDLLQQAENKKPSTTAVRHVNPTARARMGGNRRNDEEPQALGVADIAWLTRLPTDPAKISDTDAEAVAKLAVKVRPGTSDERLLRSILEPITRHHGRLEADAELRALNTTTTHFDPPASTTTVLTAAVSRDVPELRPDEARARAHKMLDDALAQVTTDRTAKRTRLEARIRELTG